MLKISSAKDDEQLLKEAKKLSWEDRLTHKNWKVRRDANIDIAALCDSITNPKDPRLHKFGPLFEKTVADSNAAVQEKALDALISFLEAADADDAGRYSEDVCNAIIAKCLTGRPKTVEKAQMVFMLWVVLEAVEAFLNAMEKAIKNKYAKAVVAAIDTTSRAVSQFGVRVIPPIRILKMLSELFDHQHHDVRASSKRLALELCRWIGKGEVIQVKSFLFEKMPDAMIKEVEAALANVPGMDRPSQKIRSVHSVDILTPLKMSGFWDGVKSTKWVKRKEAVALLTKLASKEKIAPGDFSEISLTLKDLITDEDVDVAVEALQAIRNLSRGLGTNYSSYSRLLLPVLLEKLRDNNPTFGEALIQTLQAMHTSGCLNLKDILQDVRVAVKSKVPIVRYLTFNWVTFCIETSNKEVLLEVHEEYVSICMESLNDAVPLVEDAAFSALAAVAKLVGVRPLEKSLEKLDGVRLKQLYEMIGASSTNGALGSPKPEIIPEVLAAGSRPSEEVTSNAPHGIEELYEFVDAPQELGEYELLDPADFLS